MPPAAVSHVQRSRILLMRIHNVCVSYGYAFVEYFCIKLSLKKKKNEIMFTIKIRVHETRCSRWQLKSCTEVKDFINEYP